MTDLTRPLLRYHGGKWRMAPWIISHFPNHRVYVEPYGGGGSVLLRKKRTYAEVYNDLDSEVVNVFRCARDHGEDLKKLLVLTPFAREEFEAAHQSSDDPVENARRTIVRSFQGFGADSVTGKYKSGFRSNSNRSGSTPAHDWRNYCDIFEKFLVRLRAVVVENRDAKEVMAAHDSDETLHYVDPPYVLDTRSDSRHGYRYEMDDAQHRELGGFLSKLKGMVLVSGYASPLYKEIFDGWHRHDYAAMADGAKKRIECLWLSPSTPTHDLFSKEITERHDQQRNQNRNH